MPVPALKPYEVVKTSTRLWSTEVGIAEAESVVMPHPVAYEFSNGRQFIEKSPFYARLPTEPEPEP